ncbi:snapalysin family zinc-dependent metalloprotease, partial [Streptomyces sp. NPDC002922]
MPPPTARWVRGGDGNASQAPSFRSQISSAASIWNSSESNVK